MKSVTRLPRHTSPSVNSKGRIRKSSEERKEKQKVESALRQLVGSSSSSQLDLVLSAIEYIRQLQSQLDIENTENRENTLPEGFEQLFEKTVKA